MNFKPGDPARLHVLPRAPANPAAPLPSAVDVRRQRIASKGVAGSAAAQAIAKVIPADELHADYVIPSVFNRRVAESVADAVAHAAVASGVARRKHGAAAEPATPLEAMR